MQSKGLSRVFSNTTVQKHQFFSTNLNSILKCRDVTLPTKVYLVKALVFPVVMYGCESWTIKKAECQKTDAFEKTMMLGVTGDRRRRGRQRMRRLDGITDSIDLSWSKLRKLVMDRDAWHAEIHGVAKILT